MGVAKKMYIDNKNSNRNSIIDIAKLICMTGVIIYHTYWPTNRFIFLDIFCMPTFLIISGYVFNLEKYYKYNFFDFFINRAKHYVLPLVIFSMPRILYNILTKNYYNNNIFITLRMPNVALWFLLTLFTSHIFIYIIYYFYRKVINKMNNDKIEIVSFISILVILLLIQYFIVKINKKFLPFKVETICIALALEIFGIFLKRMNILHKLYQFFSNWLLLSIIFILSYTIFRLNYCILCEYGTKNNNVLIYFFNCILSFIFIINLSNIFCKINPIGGGSSIEKTS